MLLRLLENFHSKCRLLSPPLDSGVFFHHPWQLLLFYPLYARHKKLSIVFKKRWHFLRLKSQRVSSSSRNTKNEMPRPIKATRNAPSTCSSRSFICVVELFCFCATSSASRAARELCSCHCSSNPDSLSTRIFALMVDSKWWYLWNIITAE